MRGPRPLTMPRLNIGTYTPPSSSFDSTQPDYTNDLIARVKSDIARSRQRYDVNNAARTSQIAQLLAQKIQIPNLGGVRAGTASQGSSNVRLTGGVDQWIAQAYKILGIPLTQQKLTAERLLAMKESGGKPGSVNRWDRNWIAGHPSKGIDQMIDASFRAHMIPGHTNIFNPVDNIISSIRYRLAHGNLITPGMASALRGGSYRGY